MPERTLQDRYRLLAAAFRDHESGAALRARVGAAFPAALDTLVDALWRDVGAAPRDLDREKVGELVRVVLPGRLAGDESWIALVPDLVEAFLAFVAEEESLSTAWELRSAVDEHRDAFRRAVADPGRPRLGAVKFTPDRRPAAKIGRNDPCPCGSGRKYKQCCLRLLP
jgi:hypothetical protein